MIDSSEHLSPYVDIFEHGFDRSVSSFFLMSYFYQYDKQLECHLFA